MTTIELQALTTIRTYLPQIAHSLKQIAEALSKKENEDDNH